MTVARESTGLQHDGIFYDDETTLAAAATSFIRDGIAAGELVMVNTGDHPMSPMLRALFCAEPQVVFPRHAVYATPAGTLDGYRRMLEKGMAEGVRGFRVMGFIDLDQGRLPWQEWLRYEAAVNHVLQEFPVRTLCPYDVTAASSEVIDALVRAHHGIVDESGRRPNPAYVDPTDLVTEPALRTPPHPLQEQHPRMVLQPDGDLQALRMELYAATMFTELPRLQVDDLVSAVTEVVDNAHRHGTQPVTLSLWAADRAVVCTVADRGPGFDDPLAGFARPRDPSEGVGLWGVRQLVDVFDCERTDAGFSVRLASFADD